MASSRLLRERRKSLIAGIGVFAAFLAMAVLAVTATNGLPGQSHRTVKVAFTDVGALREGDDVRIAGIRVGKVDTIELDKGRPVATLSLDGDRKVYRSGAVATINQRSALGQAYVNVTPGDPKSGALPENALIVESDTHSAQDLTNVLNVLDAKTRASLQSAVRELGNGASGHGGDLNDALAALPHALPDLANVSRALARNDGADLTGMLTDAESLARSFAGQQQEIADLADQLNTTVRAIDVDGGEPVAATLQQAPESLTSLRKGLDAIIKPLDKTTRAVNDLRTGARSLGSATPALRSVLRDGITPLNKVPGVVDKAIKPVTDLTATMNDLRPLAPRVGKAITQISTPLGILGPYAPEMWVWTTYAADCLKDGDAAGHWLRFYIPLGTENVEGFVPNVPDPLTHRNSYPAPGEALNQRTSTILGTRK